jgi:hypothetical protein
VLDAFSELAEESIVGISVESIVLGGGVELSVDSVTTGEEVASEVKASEVVGSTGMIPSQFLEYSGDFVQKSELKWNVVFLVSVSKADDIEL